jgi:hypothetical protein
VVWAAGVVEEKIILDVGPGSEGGGDLNVAALVGCGKNVEGRESKAEEGSGSGFGGDLERGGNGSRISGCLNDADEGEQRKRVAAHDGGVVKRTTGVAYAAVDGGMSDNPRPQLYGSRYEALLANRVDEPVSGTYRIAGKHCESGDVLIDGVELPEPHRDDLLAVPATGAYTLAMASYYNGVPRPAAVLVANGRAELIRRRESLDDLLRFEP